MEDRLIRLNPPRRRLLLAGLAAAGAAAPGCLFGFEGGRLNAACARELWITRPQAQESVRAVYWAEGHVQSDGYGAINRIYRDLHAGLERPIALALLNLNCAMQRAVARHGRAAPMVLLSGFRTRQTNHRVGGVEPSAHLVGEADDFIYGCLSFEENVRLARGFQVGGLGIYPDRHSLHKDLGRPRTWIEYGRPAAGEPGSPGGGIRPPVVRSRRVDP